MNPLRTFTAIALTSSLVLVAGCDSSSTDTTSSNGETSSSTQDQVTQTSWLLDEAPSEYREVAEAKQSVGEGDQVVLRGRIGGRVEPLSADSPAFIIMDAAIPSCADNEGDNCRMPWDYCCETPETIAANSATIIVLDENGNPTDEDLVAAGLEPLDEVIVVGTVQARPNGNVLTVHATGVHKRTAG